MSADSRHRDYKQRLLHSKQTPQTNSESICNCSSRKSKVKRAHPREGTHAREVQVHRAALREVDQHAPHQKLEAAVSDGLCARAEIGNLSKYDA